MAKPPEVYSSAVRFSVGVQNTPEEMDDAVERISAVISKMRNV
jgi:cysteine sulfinate desulfinase/cysteine desulfurase-like protein